MTTIVTTQSSNINFRGLKSFNYRKAGIEAQKRLVNNSMGKNKPNLSLYFYTRFEKEEQ